MRIDIKDFPNQILEFDFYIDKMEDIDLKERVHVVGTAVNNNGKVEVSGNYSTVVRTQCVRCLKDIEIELNNNFMGTYLDEAQYNQYLKSLNAECEINQDEVYDEIKDGIIDLEGLVREYIILDMPPYPQCQPVCEDDSEIEKYSDDGIDPRWQQLLQIKN